MENLWQTGAAVDCCSGDILWLGRSDVRRFLAEPGCYPNFSIALSVVLIDGNYGYLEQAKWDIAAFHGVQSGLLVGGVAKANCALWTFVPHPKDVAYEVSDCKTTYNLLRMMLIVPCLPTTAFVTILCSNITPVTSYYHSG